MRHLALLPLAALLAACAADPGASRPNAASAADPVIEAPVRSRGEANRDDALKALVTRKLAEADKLAYRAVTVEVWQGRVLLMGAVIKPEHRRNAEAIAKSAGGITKVYNDLLLAEERAFDLFSPDLGREYDVRKALELEGKAGATVRVVNGVAYLLGAASPEQAARMKADAGEVQGIKWVVNHLE
ncbi:MAG: BON domain-containing protein [Solirubrobacterales bacterium]